MVLTRAEAKAAITYILETVFNLSAGSPLHSALDRAAITSPLDLVTMRDVDYETLDYADGNNVLPLPKGYSGLLRAFKAFISHQRDNNVTITDTIWTTLRTEDFNNFRIGPSYFRSHTTPTQAPPAITPSSDPLRDFRRGIRRDISYFVALKDDGAWDNWYRATTAQARAQDVAEILDHTYTPSGPAQTSLFDEKQKYMYAVFEKTLLTDKGKALVRTHQRKYDAQAIFKELCDYALSSTKASMDASSLLTYITTTRLGDGKWKGTTHAFILHWQDQIRKYHDLAPKQKLPLDLQRTMLENAVHPVPALRIIKTQAEQHKAHTGNELDYPQYSNLLLSAAQQHDKSLLTQAPRNPRRQVYDTEQLYGPNPDTDGVYELHSIDSSIATLSINQSSLNNSNQPRLTRDQWHRLSDDAKTTWDLLPNEAKAIILQHSSRPPLPGSHAPLPKRRVNAHDIDHLVENLYASHPEVAPILSQLTACLHSQSEGRSIEQAVHDVTSTSEDLPEDPLKD